MPRDRYDDEDDRPRRRRDEDDDDRPRRRRDEDDEDDDRPRRSRRRDYDDERPAAVKGNGMAMASLVLGLLSILFGPCTGVIGGILGMIGLGRPSGKGMAVTGLILSGLFSITHTAGGIWGFFQMRESAGKYQVSLNMKQIGLAGHSHNDANGYLPMPYVKRPNDQMGQVPTDVNDRLGWRVTILPYIEQENVFRRFNFNEPWNGPTNQPISSTPIMQYSDSDARTDPTTRFRGFYDNGAIFDTKTQVRIPAGIMDGTSNTIFVVEGGDKVTWTRFQEYKFEPTGPLPPLGRADKNTYQVLMADGSTKTIRRSVSEATLKAAITRAGGEIMGPDW